MNGRVHEQEVEEEKGEKEGDKEGEKQVQRLSEGDQAGEWERGGGEREREGRGDDA